MRIVFISYLHPDIAPGGEQQVAFELFEAASEQGHQAFLIAALEHSYEERFGKPGAPIVPFPGKPRQYLFFPQFYDHLNLSVQDWRSLDFLRDLLARLEPHVVHFHHYHRIGLEAFRVARIAAPHAAICLTLHEMMAICHADGQMVKRDSRALCREATPVACNACFPAIRPEFFVLRRTRMQVLMDEVDHFVFPSEFLAERYVAWGLPPERCVVIPNGQRDLSRGFDRSRRSVPLNRFGFFGQFIDNKGVDVLLAALLLLAREKRVPPGGIVIELNAANRHFASTAYVRKVTDLLGDLSATGAPVQVIDRGSYAREELAARMGAVDWVVVPSTWWEIFGLVANEAWMFGRPVLASRIGGLAERVVDEVNGLTFPAGDAWRLADTLTRCCGDAPLWSRLNAFVPPPWDAGDMLRAQLEVARAA